MPLKTYRINAKEIEIEDKNMVFVNSNLEEVLFELYKINSKVFHFETIVNEQPTESDYNFIQDPNLLLQRNHDKINVVFDNVDKSINIYPDTNPMSPSSQTVTFYVNKRITYPYVEALASLPANSSMEIRTKKVDNSFYWVYVAPGEQIKIYARKNNSDQELSPSNNPVVSPTNVKIAFYTAKNKVVLILNGQTIYTINDVSILNNGFVEIVFRTSYNIQSPIKVKGIYVGSFVYESKD